MMMRGLLGVMGLLRGWKLRLVFVFILPRDFLLHVFWVSRCELFLFHWKSLVCQIWTLFILGHQGYEAVDSSRGLKWPSAPSGLYDPSPDKHDQLPDWPSLPP